jgi:DMSO reductase family type II enzyme chaperone
MKSTAIADSSGAAHARSQFFALVAEAFRYPDVDQLRLIGDGVLLTELSACLTQMAPELQEELGSSLADAGSADDLQLEYTRLFELASPGRGCSLHGGIYRGPRMKNMEELLRELLRFYKLFGLSLVEGQSELPDHITTQLEFLQFLSYCEAELLAGGQAAADQRRARRDFIARYPARWLPQLQDRLADKQAMDFYRSLVAILIAVLEQDYRTLAEELGEASLDIASSELMYTEIGA